RAGPHRPGAGCAGRLGLGPRQRTRQSGLRIARVRVAFTGVSHWHAPLYYRPAARIAGVRIVGVSDLSPTVAEQVGQRLGARTFTNVEAISMRRGPTSSSPSVATAICRPLPTR